MPTGALRQGVLMALKGDAKFKEKLVCVFKYDMKSLVNLHPTTQKSEISFRWVLFAQSMQATKIQKRCLS